MNEFYFKTIILVIISWIWLEFFLTVVKLFEKSNRKKKWKILQHCKIIIVIEKNEEIRNCCNFLNVGKL